MNKQMAVAIKKMVMALYPNMTIVNENIDTTPPVDDAYLRLTISPAEKLSPFLSRQGKYEIFLIQVDIIYPRNMGADSARSMADNICDNLTEGTDIVLDGDVSAYISEDARAFPSLQNDTSYSIPVRCYCRVDIFN